MNVWQALAHAGTGSRLVALIVGTKLADRGASNAVVAFALGAIFFGGAVAVWRYLPMAVVIDLTTERVYFRKACKSGSFQWSSARFEPKEVLLGMYLAEAVLPNGRRITLHAAPFDDVTTALMSRRPADELDDTSHARLLRDRRHRQDGTGEPPA